MKQLQVLIIDLQMNETGPYVEREHDNISHDS